MICISFDQVIQHLIFKREANFWYFAGGGVYNFISSELFLNNDALSNMIGIFKFHNIYGKFNEVNNFKQ
jgi:hypothetical protein